VGSGKATPAALGTGELAISRTVKDGSTFFSILTKNPHVKFQHPTEDTTGTLGTADRDASDGTTLPDKSTTGAFFLHKGKHFLETLVTATATAGATAATTTVATAPDTSTTGRFFLHEGNHLFETLVTLVTATATAGATAVITAPDKSETTCLTSVVKSELIL
jgi:hypothetical protein